MNSLDPKPHHESSPRAARPGRICGHRRDCPWPCTLCRDVPICDCVLRASEQLALPSKADLFHGMVIICAILSHRIECCHMLPCLHFQYCESVSNEWYPVST